jgi:TRAP-type mannitol/chloroaromatic compound transport system permease small subunit
MPEVDMPSLDFTLPHWLYWAGLIVFPLVAMMLARRPRRGPPRYGAALGYMILVTGGILGLHRIYLRSLLGLLYVPAFLVVLYANGQETAARDALSDVANQVRMAERIVAREAPRIEEAEAELPELRAALEEAEPGSFAERSAQRRIERAEETLSAGAGRLAEAEAEVAEVGALRDEARDARAFWSRLGALVFYAILAALAVDALLLPWMVRRANATAPEEHEDPTAPVPADDRDRAENWIDRLSLFTGEFAAYWAVIAVFVYFYEVIARYVFNAPTNWAHEGMYLMFGMQYLIAGAYAMLTESHVRVDIFYAPLPLRKKAWTDLVTSVFFFIFAGTLLFTAWTFAMDSLAVPQGNALISDYARGEIGLGDVLAEFDAGQITDPRIRWGELSFNEWEVPLWPMKWVMVMGGALLVLQGISKLSKDIRTLRRGVPQGEPA